VKPREGTQKGVGRRPLRASGKRRMEQRWRRLYCYELYESDDTAEMTTGALLPPLKPQQPTAAQQALLQHMSRRRATTRRALCNVACMHCRQRSRPARTLQRVEHASGLGVVNSLSRARQMQKQQGGEGQVRGRSEHTQEAGKLIAGSQQLRGQCEEAKRLASWYHQNVNIAVLVRSMFTHVTNKQ